MSDNTNKPGDHVNDGPQRRVDKVSEQLSKGTPEVSHNSLRAAQKANLNRTDTVSPDGKSRFGLTDDSKPTVKQSAAQEKAYRDAGLGDPHKPLGKSSREPHIDGKVIASKETVSKAGVATEASQHKLEAEPVKPGQPNLDRAKEAARNVLQTVAIGGLYEGGSLLKGIKDKTAPEPSAEKTRFAPAGTPLEIRGHSYPLNELTAQNADKVSDARDKPKDNPMAGVPTVVGKDGVRRLEGHFQPEQSDEAKLIEAVGKVIEPVTQAVSRFNAESTKALHHIVEQGREAVGLSHPHVSKPVHAATGDGSTLPKPIQNPGDAMHLGIGATTGFTKAINEMMPGLTPKGVIGGAAQAVKQAGALVQAHNEHEAKFHKNPIGTVLHDAATAGKMYDGAVDWANKRSQTESFAQRGQDIGKASPDIMMLNEIVFIARSGRLITPRDATNLQLETKTPEALEKLGIKRVTSDQVKPEDMVNPIDRSAPPKEKVRQLEQLSKANEPLVKDFAKHIDEKFGTKSESNLKDPKDILLKSVRADIREKQPWFDVEHVRDALRFKTEVEDLRSLPAIAKKLKESNFQIIKVDVDQLLNPKGRGWRMAAFDLRAPNGLSSAGKRNE